MTNHNFDNVRPGARLEIDVRQEGQAHSVSGRLRFGEADLACWPFGELEDRVTSVILGGQGLYLLFLHVAFFGPQQKVSIAVRVHDSGSVLLQYEETLKGSAGDADSIVTKITVN